MIQEMRLKLFCLIVVGAIMVVVGTYFFTTLGPRVEAVVEGELIPFKVDDRKEFDIQMGGCHVLVTFDQLRQGYDFQKAFYFAGIDYPFELRFKDGKLLVSAEVKNSNGDVVAKIFRNQWSVDYNPIVIYDRNYNSYAFEAIDSDRFPILQVVMTPENRVFVGGIFYGENSTLVAMLNGTTVYNPSYLEYNQTIFEYPSESKLGKLVTDSPYDFGSSQHILAPDQIIIIGYVLLGIGTVIISFVGAISLKKGNSENNNKKQKRAEEIEKRKSRKKRKKKK
jgi:hypothetical protein